MSNLYGNLPKVVSLIDLSNNESMLYLYLPIKLKGTGVCLPKQLEKLRAIVDAVKKDQGDKWDESNVYLTAKCAFVSGSNTYQRPGWHSDGFMTEDVNYLWFDKEPTEFYFDGALRTITQDHSQSLAEMDEMCRNPEFIVRPEKKALLKLDQSVIHRPPEIMESGFRNFIKISVSDMEYHKLGNSINYDDEILNITSGWDYTSRSLDRNCPAS